MEKILNKITGLRINIAGFFIELFKGSEARNKWVFKQGKSQQQKRLMEEQKRMLLDGFVPLDDIEIASFHKS